MLFNSISFLIFFSIVFILYWLIFNKSHRSQNILILCSSYFFYAWWDWRFLSLIFLSTIVDFFIGHQIFRVKGQDKRCFYLCCSIFFNVSLLGFFKYFNFFIDSWINLLDLFGFTIQNFWFINIILPVGISFYTFQTMSYSIDIYLKKLKPTKDFIAFATFVSFFPQLIAGPIERASNLLPQILSKRIFYFKNITQGIKIIIWGLFKKVVIADNCSTVVSNVFNNYNEYSGLICLLSAFLFSIQIYCDFSGYSDIAIGLSKCLGIKLMTNFKVPYFSQNITDFWRRWHISLSSWFKDYIFIPLGGSKKGEIKTIKNIFVVFILSGLWHGANWTFIFWGIGNGILYILYKLIKNLNIFKVNNIKNSFIQIIFSFIKSSSTFFSITLLWVLFRSNTLNDALSYYSKIWSISINDQFNFDNSGLLVLIFILFMIESIFKNRDFIFDTKKMETFQSNLFNYFILPFIVWLIIILEPNQNAHFIYFQF